VRCSHGLPVLGGDAHLVESRTPSLLDLARLGHQRRLGRHRGQKVDGHAQRHGRFAVGVAGGTEGDVGQREDDAPVREALKIHHVRLQAQTQATISATDVDVLDPE
jgi:hypothetical protein